MASRPTAKLCLILATLLGTAATAAPPPLKLFGQLPTVGEIYLSPDGSRYAATLANEKTTQVQVRTTADNKIVAAAAADFTKVRDITWVGNDHIVATVSNTEDAAWYTAEKRERFRLMALALAKPDRWRQLLVDINKAQQFVYGKPRAIIREGQPTLLVPGLYAYTDVYTLSLIGVNLNKAGGWLQELGTPETSDYLLDVDGAVVARVDYGERTGEWRVLLNGQGGYRRVYSESAAIDTPSLVSFGRDTSTLLINSRKSGEWQDYLLQRSDGAVALAGPDYAGDKVLLDPRSGTVIGTRTTGFESSSTNFLAPADQAFWRGLAKAFPGETISLLSWSADRKLLIIEVQGPANGVALFRVDRNKGSVDYLADRYEGIGPEMINPVTTYRYKAADGLEIPAYLTLPKGRPAKGLPLIVLAHGGPEGRDEPGFDWWAQALASRGYAVLQPQFRGSTGFGTALRDAGFGQWGRKMQTDLSDGVQDLVTKSMVDPRRVCIAGASYGGYAAMAGVALQQGVYRCASSVSGRSDLSSRLAPLERSVDGRKSINMRYFQRFFGVKSSDDPLLDAISPAMQAGRVSAPLQLIHGKDDTVVPVEQSRLMRDAMAKAGKPLEYLELPGEDHWLSRPATRIAMLEAQVAFLEKHNPPDPAP